MSVWPILSAVDINDRGDVVGVISAFPSARAALRHADGRLVTIDPLPGDDQNDAAAMNNQGQVIGRSFNTSTNVVRAFIWKEGIGAVDIGTLGGGMDSPTGINDRGDVVGYSQLTPGAVYPQTAFLWRPGKGMTDLGALIGDRSASIARDIDEESRVVGSSARGAFIWSTTSLEFLPLGANAVAAGINRFRTVVGSYHDFASGQTHAYRWSSNTGLVDMGTLGGDWSAAHRIGDDGTIAGSWLTTGFAVVRAFGARGNQMVDLAGNWAGAFGVNRCGVVSGWASGGNPSSQSYGAIWVPRGIPLSGDCR